jgi:hypothetical protein
MRTRVALLAAAGAAMLGGCADYGYGGYGSGLSIGLGYGGGYYSPYDYGYGYSPFGYGYGYGPFDYGGWYSDPYFGWYGGGYYPGTGVYVYDSYRRPHRWNDQQQRYWTQRQQSVTTTATTSNRQRPQFHENWSGFNRRSNDRTTRTDTSNNWRHQH